ncbi:MAG: hypothetical protein IT427_18605 [Pirellulales bacterium]|nr:hypothetical protein [Pirellulales bacterium]
MPRADKCAGGRFYWPEWSARIAKLNAPRASGEKLIEPPLELAAEMMAANRSGICSADYELQGRGLGELACEARKQLLAAAVAYTRAYRDVALPDKPAAIFLAGHQPEMFHPGVWLKNFALNQLAQQHGAVAINLQIDSDTMKSSSLRVPVGSVDAPRMEAVPFDRGTTDTPFEQRPILDPSLFRSFGDRAALSLRPLITDPLLKSYWPLAVVRSRETDNIGHCVSQARHQLEAQWGLQTLEIPQSRVCDLPALRWFVAHLLAQLPRLWEIYNSALLEYRREHKVRSSAHPVPELNSVDGWLEAPLWIWSSESPSRLPLFVRQRNDELVLSNRSDIEAVISITPEGTAESAVEQLAALSARGVRLRTRALITTLAARLLLGDLFMHGIGGAKYDQLTDRIIERFFGIRPTAYLCVSGTLRLPVPVAHRSDNGAIHHRHCIRELQYHPERFIDVQSAGNNGNAQSADRWIAEKLRWIAVEQTPHNARERCHAIHQANEALQPFVVHRRDAWTADALQRAKDERSEKILLSREYGFPLFPESTLTNFFGGLLEKSSSSD